MKEPGLILVLVVVLTSVSGRGAETASLSPLADTCLWEFDPDYNFGAQTEIPAGTLGSLGDGARSRALFKFDIASKIPANAVITSAQLQVTVVRSPSGRNSSTFAMHRVLREWNEGMKSGDLPGGRAATAGESTWNARLEGESAWGEPGGEFGVDFDPNVSATAAVSGNRDYVLTLNAQGLRDVQSMLTNPAENHGWVFLSQSENTEKTARRFGSRERSSGAPILTIEYEVPTPFEVPLESTRFESASNEVVIRVSTVPGAEYALQRSEVETPNNWVTVTMKEGDQSGFLELSGSTEGVDVVFFRVIGSLPAS